MSDSSPSADPLLGRVVDGRYRIVRRLGSGGMGAVYAAEQLNLGRDVAIKVLKPGVLDDAFRARFKAEAMATSRLNHPNIITVHDFGIDVAGATPLPYLVLEKLDGESLRERLDARGRMPVDDAVAVCMGIASALADAHASGIIHRDLKPENVFLVRRQDGAVDVKVLDFGIAKMLELDGAHTQTESGVVVGTPGYVAPERMQVGSDDPRGDLYALGVVAFELLGGQPPFAAPTPMALAVKHMFEPPPRLATLPGIDVPRALDDLVASLLAKTAEARPRDAIAARLAFRAALELRAPPSPSPSPSPSPPTLPLSTSPTSSMPAAFMRPEVRSRKLRGAAGALALVVAFAAIWILTHRESAGARATREYAAGNLAAAADAWFSGCRGGEGPSCLKLGDLLRREKDVAFDASALEDCVADAGPRSPLCAQAKAGSSKPPSWAAVYRHGCLIGDAACCVAFGRISEGFYRSAVPTTLAAAAFTAACRSGSGLGCFHAKVIDAAGQENNRTEVGLIAVTPEERTAAEVDCAAGADSACFALSLIDVRLARAADRLDDVVASRKRWAAWCAREHKEFFNEPCHWLNTTDEADAERALAEASTDPEAKAAHLQAALLFSPEDVDALYGLAAIAARRKDEAGACRLLRRVFVLEPVRRRDVVGDDRFAALRTTAAFAALRGD